MKCGKVIMENDELRIALTDIASDLNDVGIVWYKAYTPLSVPFALEIRKEWNSKIRAVYNSLDSTVVWDRKLSVYWSLTGACVIGLRA